MVRNLGASPGPYETVAGDWLVSCGNLFTAGGNHGAVRVDARGSIPVDFFWQPPDQVVIAFPPNARVFKQKSQFPVGFYQLR